MFEEIKDEFSQISGKYFRQLTELKKQNTDMSLRLFCKCIDVLDKMKEEILGLFRVPDAYADTFEVDNRKYNFSIEKGEISVKVTSEDWCGETLIISTDMCQGFSDLVDYHIQKVDIGLACHDITENAERLVKTLLECIIADSKEYYKEELAEQIEINNKLKGISKE